MRLLPDTVALQTLRLGHWSLCIDLSLNPGCDRHRNKVAAGRHSDPEARASFVASDEFDLNINPAISRRLGLHLPPVPPSTSAPPAVRLKESTVKRDGGD